MNNPSIPDIITKFRDAEPWEFDEDYLHEEGMAPIPLRVFVVRFDSDELWAGASGHTNVDGEFIIDNLDVPKGRRREGLGKQILRATLAEARKTDALCIRSCIISAECLAAMRAVFGEDAIEIIQQSPFGALPDETWARLNYPLEPDIPK